MPANTPRRTPPITIAATEAGGWLALTVADDGPGIPPEDRDRVFDMFYRARGGDGQPTGTGLGLAICKGILEAHGGRIPPAPVEPGGRGTKILVELPLGRRGGQADSRE